MAPHDLLLQNLDSAFDRASFHGTTLRGSLRGLAVARAVWRPAPQRHNIWEELLHCAYWKYIVRRRLVDAKVTFPRSPSNWPAPPATLTKATLRDDIAVLLDEHQKLRAAVAAFPARRLREQPTASGPAFLDLILGVAAHDLYHTGQIQLLKRLHADLG